MVLHKGFSNFPLGFAQEENLRKGKERCVVKVNENSSSCTVRID